MCLTYPGRVLEIVDGMALVEIDQATRRASTVLVPETTVGDWVVVAAGAVMRILDPVEAGEIRALLDEALGDETPIPSMSAEGGLKER